jgi:hypothetical protein
MTLRTALTAVAAAATLLVATGPAQALPLDEAIPLDPLAGARVTELKAPTPAWFTDELRAPGLHRRSAGRRHPAAGGS